jgi:hypothetical protein
MEAETMMFSRKGDMTWELLKLRMGSELLERTVDDAGYSLILAECKDVVDEFYKEFPPLRNKDGKLVVGI